MTNDDERDRRLALAALALSEPGPAPGPRPEIGELWDWMAGEIRGERAAQIESHVARDPQVHEEWRQLRMALAEERREAVASRAEAAPPTREVATGSGSDGWFERLRDWLAPMPLGGAFATLAVLGVAVSVSQRQAPPSADFWQDWQVLKSVERVEVGADERPELRAFLVGMHDRMREMTIAPVGPDGRPLPDDVEACDGSDPACARRREALRELGNLSVLSRYECVLGTDTVRERQQRAGELLQTLETQASAERLITPLRNWADADSTRSRCGAISELVARGLVVHEEPPR